MGTEAQRITCVVLSNCTDPARQDEFQHWYDEIHLPDMMEMPLCIRAQRLGRIDGAGNNAPRVLAVYEYATGDVEAVQREIRDIMRPKLKAGRGIDCMEQVIVGYYVLARELPAAH